MRVDSALEQTTRTNLETQSSKDRTVFEQAEILHKGVESEVIQTAEVRRKQAPTSQKGKSLPVVI